MHSLVQAARERFCKMTMPSNEEKTVKNDAMIQHKKRLQHEWKQEEHPGRLLGGHLLLDRAPGNFHILARAKHQWYT
jgi:hypothetical protein